MERTLSLNGTTFTVAFTARMIAECDRRMKRPTAAIIYNAATNVIGFDEIHTLLHVALRGQKHADGKIATEDDVWAIMEAHPGEMIRAARVLQDAIIDVIAPEVEADAEGN